MRAAATLGTRAVAGARGHARMQKSEPVNVTKKFFEFRVNLRTRKFLFKFGEMRRRANLRSTPQR